MQGGRIRREDIVAFNALHDAYKFKETSLMLAVNALPKRPAKYDGETAVFLQNILKFKVAQKRMCFLDHVEEGDEKGKELICSRMFEIINDCTAQTYRLEQEIILHVDEIRKLTEQIKAKEDQFAKDIEKFKKDIENANKTIAELKARPPQTIHQCHTSTSGGGGCFHPDTTVMNSDGKLVTMKQLNVGDSVATVEQSGKIVFSQVYFIHRHNYKQTPIITLTIQTPNQQQQLRMTPEHIIFIVPKKRTGLDCNTEDIFGNPIQSHKVQVGDNIWFFDQQQGHTVECGVLKKEEEIWEGEVVNPLTMSNTLLAESILCSCFTINHKFSAIDCLPMKLIFKVFPSIVSSKIFISFVDAWDSVSEGIVARFISVI